MENETKSTHQVRVRNTSREKRTGTSIDHKTNGAQIAWYLSIAIILGLMLLLPTIGTIHYFLDLFTHFQGQYLILMIFLLFIGLLLPIRKLGLSIIALIIIIHFAILIHPVQVVSTSDLTRVKETDLYYLNVLHFNDDVTSIENQIFQADPEVVAFVEANETLNKSISERYGNPADIQGTGASTCTIFSKGDFEEYEIDREELIYPICSLMKERTVIIVIHPYPPLSQEFFDQQNKHFVQIKEIIDGIIDDGYNFILIGDFNSTYYTRQFREYFGEYHEKSIYSWEADRLWSIPIDHALSDLEIQIFAAPKTSSDHSAILVDYK